MNNIPFVTIYSAIVLIITAVIFIKVRLGLKKGRMSMRFRRGSKRVYEGEDLKKFGTLATICTAAIGTGAVLMFIFKTLVVFIPIFLISVIFLVVKGTTLGRPAGPDE